MRRTDLERLGFQGFIPFSAVLDAPDLIPARAGVYSVSCPAGFRPRFLAKGSGGFFKGKDPNVPVSRLSAKWIPQTDVLYFGKAGPGKRLNRGLRKRVLEYARFGGGDGVGHWGGRLIWQLEGASSLLVSWLVSDQDFDLLESKLLQSFLSQHDRLPFANLVARRA